MKEIMKIILLSNIALILFILVITNTEKEYEIRKPRVTNFSGITVNTNSEIKKAWATSVGDFPKQEPEYKKILKDFENKVTEFRKQQKEKKKIEKSKKEMEAWVVNLGEHPEQFPEYAKSLKEMEQRINDFKKQIIINKVEK